jgi:peptidoglycan/xylan/chitin deacetylase (PgdA/CDA1 family)
MLGARHIGSALGYRWESTLIRGAGGFRHLDRSHPQVALTFDDGPDPRFTPILLDRLADAGVLATFFWIGARAQEHPELSRQVRSAGHAVGSHSFSHQGAGSRSVAELHEDYARGRSAVEEATGEPTVLFRPPYGAVTTRSFRALRRAGLQPCLWSVNPNDWRTGVTTAMLLEAVSSVRPGDVVLLHDGCYEERANGDRSATVDLIGPLAEYLRMRGLSPVTLDGRGAA